jgi:hypothetical protein
MTNLSREAGCRVPHSCRVPHPSRLCEGWDVNCSNRRVPGAPFMRSHRMSGHSSEARTVALRARLQPCHTHPQNEGASAPGVLSYPHRCRGAPSFAPLRRVGCRPLESPKNRVPHISILRCGTFERSSNRCVKGTALAVPHPSPKRRGFSPWGPILTEAR